MKRRLFGYFVAATASIALLSSCSDNDTPPPVVEGKPTTMKVSITQPNVHSALTARKRNASDGETRFTTVDVFIYNASTGALEKYQRLDGANDFTPEEIGNGIYVGNASIPTTTGEKNIYVGVNLPLAVANGIRARGPVAAQTIASIDEIIDNGTSGFAMFSSSVVTTTLTTNPEDPSNNLNINVKRLVAKVALQQSSGLSLVVPGGVLSNLEYNSRNINKTFYSLPLFEEGTFKDPNWLSLPDGVIKGADFYNAPLNEFIAINQSTVTSNKDLVAKYLTENSSQNQFADEMSYVVLRAEFVPEKIVVYTNGTDANGGFNTQSDNSANSVVTFYRLRLSTGEIFYTIDADVAADYASFRGEIDPKIDIYVDGHCYYLLYVNPTKKYDVFRNDFYKVTISKINGLGRPSAIDDGHVPLASPTEIVISVTVEDWNLIDYDEELPGS